MVYHRTASCAVLFAGGIQPGILLLYRIRHNMLVVASHAVNSATTCMPLHLLASLKYALLSAGLWLCLWLCRGPLGQARHTLGWSCVTFWFAVVVRYAPPIPTITCIQCPPPCSCFKCRLHTSLLHEAAHTRHCSIAICSDVIGCTMSMPRCRPDHLVCLLHQPRPGPIPGGASGQGETAVVT
jgi:hypothetical protein